MAGLDPAIHVLAAKEKEVVDARVKPGHDEGENASACRRPPPPSKRHRNYRSASEPIPPRRTLMIGAHFPSSKNQPS